MRSIKRASSKKRMQYLSLLMLLLCLSIGYAYLSEAIKINTSANIGKMSWDIHLENIVIRSGSVSAIPPAIGSDKTSVTLSVTLNQPNEYYEYYVDVVNNGSIDAQVESLFKTNLSAAQAKYIDYTITYKDGIDIKRDDLLKAGEKETLKILVYIKDLHPSLYPSINEALTLEGKINYIQKNGNGVERNTKSLYQQIVNNTQSDSQINFGAISSDTNGLGVYTLSSTIPYAHPIYYYRGAVTDNNVIFGGFCWKIIRTTTTGGIKMIYNGSPNNGICNNTGIHSEIGGSAFNTEGNDPKYVGYMYDNNTVDSTIKGVIDTWFSNNLEDYLSYLEDTPFYNERDYVIGDFIAYAPRARLYGLTWENNKELVLNPTIKLGATNIEDIFTISSDNGNGALTYPIGLITSDEFHLAGGRGYISESDAGANSSYYLFSGSLYWTMSPNVYLYNSMPCMFYITGTGTILGPSASDVAGIRPVISLKPGTIYTSGNGTSASPYII